MQRDPSTTPERVEAFRVPVCNENLSACKICGGHCCNSMGCEIYPQDVKQWFASEEITKEMIMKIFNSGMVTLDWWTGDIREHFKHHVDSSEMLDRSFYLHMRNIGEGPIFGSWGGKCKALLPTGCSIPWDKRPIGAKALVPSKTGNPKDCHSELRKPECALSWIPYEAILSEIFEEYDPGDPFTLLLDFIKANS